MTVPYRPTWLDPAQPGYINNKHGSNVGSDNIKATFRFRSPAGSGASIAAMRSTWSRIASAGGSGVAATLWNRPSLGNPATSLLPAGTYPVGLGGADGLSGTVTAVYNGRMYIIGGRQGTVEQAATADVWSAPCDGPCIGSWRRENPLPVQTTSGGPLPLSGLAFAVGGVTSDGYLVVAGGHDQLPQVLAGFVFTCPINSDGTLGPWTQQVALPAGRVYAAGFIRNNVITVAGGSASTSAPAAVTTVYYATITAGVISSWTTSANVLNVGVYGGTAIHRPDNGTYLIAGGVNAAAAVVGTVQKSTVTAGVPGVWAAAANALPAVRCFGTGGWVPFFAGQTFGAAVVLGGDSTVGPNGTKTNTVYTANTPDSAGWVTSGTTLPSASDSGAVYAGQLIENESVLFHIGGYIGANVVRTIYYSRIASNGAVGAFGNGAGATLTTAQVNDLPYGGSVTTNSDGTVDVVFVYGGYDTQGQPFPVLDGDLLQVTVTVWETSSGDPSVAFSTLIRIAQPPTIGSAAVGAGGQPACSFKYLGGAGGADEASWRVTVGGLFDSGLRLDQVNSVVLSQAPMFPNSVQQTASITVKSKDTPMSGQSNSATTTVNFTPAGTLPALPTAVTATPNHAQGSVTIAWTNPGAITGNRIYYKRSAQALWNVYADNIAPTFGAQQTYVAMDELALGIQYDFAVSCLTATGEAASVLANPDVELSPSGSASTQTLFKSLGTDATGTLNAWTTDGGAPSIAANVLTMPNGAQIHAGHSDWTDGTFTCRMIWATGSKPAIGLHAPAPIGGNLILAEADGSNLVLRKDVGNVLTTVAGVAFAPVNATAYWLRIQASGTTYTASVFADTAGAIGAQIATISGTITDATLQSGAALILVDGSGTAGCTFGGAFAGVCSFTGPAPVAWAPSIQTGEPAFCWSKANPYSGAFSLSIYNAHSSGQGQWVYSDIAGGAGYKPALASTSYTGSCYIKTVGAAGTGARLFFNEYTSVPAYIRSDLLATVTGTAGWAQQSGAPTTAANAAYVQPIADMTGIGTAYFDFFSLGLTSALSVKIDPVQGGLSGMLHVAGKGTTYNAPLLMEQRPAIATKLDVVQLLPFAQQAPSVRNGVLYYRLVKVRVFLSSPAALRALQALIVQDITGGNLYYRDAFGTMLLCTFEPDQGVVYEPPSYRYADLTLFEIANQYAPSVSQGSASGYRSWANGSVVPLDTSEGGL